MVLCLWQGFAQLPLPYPISSLHPSATLVFFSHSCLPISLRPSFPMLLSKQFLHDPVSITNEFRTKCLLNLAAVKPCLYAKQLVEQNCIQPRSLHWQGFKSFAGREIQACPRKSQSRTATWQATRFLDLLSRPVAQSYPPSCITIDKKLISTFSHPVAVDRHALSAPLHVGTSTCQCFWTFECKEVSAQTCWCEGNENETEHNMQEGHLCTHVPSNRQGMCWISTLCAKWHQTNSLRKSVRLYRRWKIHVFRRKSEQWT